MYHSLNTDLAERIGVAPALVAQILWDETDEGVWTKTAFHKGRLWLKASYTSLATVMPYLSYHQVRAAVDRLATLGIIQKISRIAKSSLISIDRNLLFPKSSESARRGAFGRLFQRGETIELQI